MINLINNKLAVEELEGIFMEESSHKKDKLNGEPKLQKDRIVLK
jgi:hypothetical protein